MLAGAASGVKGSKGSYLETAGLKYKLICCFKLAAGMVGDVIREFMNEADRPAFLERELMGLGVDIYR